MKWVKNLQKFISDQNNLEDQIFAVVLLVGIAAVSASIVITYAEGLSPIANMGAASAAIMLLIVIHVAYVRKRIDIARLILCYSLNCLIVPFAFFFCGGIDSGMPLYMIASLFLLVPVLSGVQRIICIVVSIFVDIYCIMKAYSMMPSQSMAGEPKVNILAKLTLEARITDMICSVTLIGLYITITTMLIMDAYQKERAKREELLVRLDDLSRKDELTGLYNRRELFRFLEEAPVAKDDRYYLAMIDIDHFKKLNDTYGHVFGDAVLRRLAGIMKEGIKESGDEIIARYGGEEFMMVIRADDDEAAFQRIDSIRESFAGVKWENDPGLKTSFSGGLVHCIDYRDYADAVSNADKLLYFSKEKGRNRVSVKADK